MDPGRSGQQSTADDAAHMAVHVCQMMAHREIAAFMTGPLEPSQNPEPGRYLLHAQTSDANLVFAESSPHRFEPPHPHQTPYVHLLLRVLCHTTGSQPRLALTRTSSVARRDLTR